MVVSRDVVAGVLLLATSIGYYVLATRIPVSPLDTTIDSSVLPKWLGLLGACLSVVLIIQGLVKQWREAPAESAAARAAAMRQLWLQHSRAAVILAIASGYAVLLPVLGYFASLILLIAAVSWYQARFYKNVRPWRVMVGVPLVGALLFWAIFDQMLGIRMPTGFWHNLW